MLLWAGVLYGSAVYFCMVGFVAIIVFEYMQYFLPQTTSLSEEKKKKFKACTIFEEAIENYY